MQPSITPSCVIDSAVHCVTVTFGLSRLWKQHSHTVSSEVSDLQHVLVTFSFAWFSLCKKGRCILIQHMVIHVLYVLLPHNPIPSPDTDSLALSIAFILFQSTPNPHTHADLRPETGLIQTQNICVCIRPWIFQTNMVLQWRLFEAVYSAWFSFILHTSMSSAADEITF